jgi:hypothetical protein
MYGAIVSIPSVCTPLALSFTLDRREVRRRCVLILQACRGSVSVRLAGQPRFSWPLPPVSLSQGTGSPLPLRPP